jgi:hypothetical protein
VSASGGNAVFVAFDGMNCAGTGQGEAEGAEAGVQVEHRPVRPYAGDDLLDEDGFGYFARL